MPYEMRHVVEFAREGRRHLQAIRGALKEIENRRSRLGGDFMNEQRFRGPAGQVKQQISEIERAVQRLSSALDDIERLAR